MEPVVSRGFGAQDVGRGVGGRIFRGARLGRRGFVGQVEGLAVRVVHLRIGAVGGVVCGRTDERLLAPPLVETSERTEHLVGRGVGIACGAEVEREERAAAGIGLLAVVGSVRQPQVPGRQQLARAVVGSEQGIARHDVVFLAVDVERSRRSVEAEFAHELLRRLPHDAHLGRREFLAALAPQRGVERVDGVGRGQHHAVGLARHEVLFRDHAHLQLVDDRLPGHRVADNRHRARAVRLLAVRFGGTRGRERSGREVGLDRPSFRHGVQRYGAQVGAREVHRRRHAPTLDEERGALQGQAGVVVVVAASREHRHGGHCGQKPLQFSQVHVVYRFIVILRRKSVFGANIRKSGLNTSVRARNFVRAPPPMPPAVASALPCTVPHRSAKASAAAERTQSGLSEHAPQPGRTDRTRAFGVELRKLRPAVPERAPDAPHCVRSASPG